MKWKTIKQKAVYYGQFFPFSFNALFFTLIMIWVHHFLYKPVPKDDPAPYLPFILLMAKLVYWFFLSLVALSVASTLLCFVHYLWLKKKKNIKLELRFSTSTKGIQNRLYLNATLEGVQRPILGFVNGRLFYDDNYLTDAFSLLSATYNEKHFFRKGIEGKSRLILPDIKEYELKKAFVSFQDMLHLFKLSISEPISGHFYQPPMADQKDDLDVYPKSTEQLEVRIDQLRRVDGEHLNYKDFETGDDVRRIVWKVYAKNRELLVRIPELFEPYASHLYFYISFYSNQKKNVLFEDYSKEMLNYFKNYSWAVYKNLIARPWEMRYVPDQNFLMPENLSKEDYDTKVISSSEWQQEKTLSEYFNVKKGAVLCISSFTDPNDLATVLDQCDAGTVVYFIKTSHAFKQLFALNWLKRLLFIPPKDRLSKLKSRWMLSSKRIQVRKQEKAILDVLKTSKVNWAVL
jgi:hypothetical protein